MWGKVGQYIIPHRGLSVCPITDPHKCLIREFNYKPMVMYINNTDKTREQIKVTNNEGYYMRHYIGVYIRGGNNIIHE